MSLSIFYMITVSVGWIGFKRVCTH